MGALGVLSSSFCGASRPPLSSKSGWCFESLMLPATSSLRQSFSGFQVITPIFVRVCLRQTENKMHNFVIRSCTHRGATGSTTTVFRHSCGPEQRCHHLRKIPSVFNLTTSSQSASNGICFGPRSPRHTTTNTRALYRHSRHACRHTTVRPRRVCVGQSGW